MNAQVNQTKHTLVAELIIDDPVKGVMHGMKVDNLAVAGMQPMSTKLVVYVTRSECEAMLKKEKENASSSTICLV